MDWRESEKSIFLSRIYDLKRRKQLELAEEEVRTALERHPDEVRFQILLAELLWNQERRPQAEAMVAGMAGRAGRLHAFHSLKGAMELARQEFGQALDSYRSAYSLQPKNFYLKRQADCLIRMQQFEQAWGILSGLTADDDVYCLGAAAQALQGLGRPQEAEQMYRRILSLSPDDAFARSQLLKLAVAAKDEPLAQQEVDRMLRLPSRRNDAALLKIKAEQLRRQNRHAEAAEVYEKLVQVAVGRERDFCRRQLAFCYYKADMDPLAYPLLLDLVSARPRDTYLRSTLIALARRRGALPEAADFFAGLARKSPANAFLFGVVRRIQSEIGSAGRRQ